MALPAPAPRDTLHTLRADDDQRTQFLTQEPLGNALPVGHLLRHFRIDALIGEGGFGIVYRASDLQLKRSVAIKEYMPASLALRCADLSVVVRSPRCAQTFHKGLRSFVAEAQTLASFERSGEALVKVHDFWEGNGTAYMVMRCYEGPTLAAWLALQPSPPDEAWLSRLLAPLLDVLEHIHAGQPPCYHRDIAPDNIMLLDPDRPLLLDFGAARRVIGDATQDLSVVFKPGYAPVEQYGESASLRQGPWTDVYALCAVLYFAIAGEAPLPSVNRLGDDTLVPLAQRAAGRYSARFLEAIDAGLRLRPQERPQSMAALRTLLLPQRALDTAPGGAGVPPPMDPQDRAVATPAPARRELVLGGAATLALSALGLIGAGVWQHLTPPAPVQAPQRTDPPEHVPPPPLPPPPTSTPFNLAAALDDIVQHADPARAVSVQLRKARLAIGKDSLRYRVSSASAGHVYVYLASADLAHLHLLFPDDLDRDNRIRPNLPLDLPRKGGELVAAGPAGTDRMLVLVSAQPRDLFEAGLPVTHEGIPAFDLGVATRAWAAQPGSGKALLGRPLCTDGAACDEAYGAALVRIEEV